MKEDIELTRMHNTYEEIWEKIVGLLEECIEKNGELYSANVMRKLAIEMGARNIFAAAAVVQDEDPQDLLLVFIRSIHSRHEQLVEDAVKQGLMKRSEE
jgi:hypothetical protein